MRFSLILKIFIYFFFVFVFDSKKSAAFYFLALSHYQIFNVWSACVFFFFLIGKKFLGKRTVKYFKYAAIFFLFFFCYLWNARWIVFFFCLEIFPSHFVYFFFLFKCLTFYRIFFLFLIASSNSCEIKLFFSFFFLIDLFFL